jgi:OOP family OmpA-OmpF porin
MRYRMLLILNFIFLNITIYFAQEMIQESVTEEYINNPSFEINSGCPTSVGEINLCDSWYCPWIRETPDYWCVNCDSMSNGIAFDSLYPKDGNCFITLVIRNGKYYSAQEHIQTRFTTTLKKDKRYKLTFFVRTADDSHFYTDRFAVAFSEDSLSSFGAVKKKKYWMVEYKDAILVKDDSFFSKNYQWQKIELEYIANGNEKFLTIGIFSNNLRGYKRQAKFRTKNQGKNNLGYYDLDLIQLFPLGNVSNAPNGAF